MTKPKLVIVVTVSPTLSFYRGQLDYLREKGYEITIVSSGGKELEQFGHEHAVQEITMTRGVSILKDLIAVVKMTRLFLGLKPDIVHGSTPKAGLLSILAATMARVPLRFYTVRGLPAETLSGFSRLFLLMLEHLTCFFATRIIVNSQSLLEVIKKENLCQAEKMKVIHKGSSNGVDATNRFNPTNVIDETLVRLKTELGIGENKKIIGFVGRLATDKGLCELAQAWKIIRSRDELAYLLIVGSADERDPASEAIAGDLVNDHRVILCGEVDNSLMPLYYSVMDILVLPTYREGFPNVALEASAMELPVVATKVTGCVDAVVHGVTGTLVPLKDCLALADSIITYLENPELRRKHGRAGRVRALKEFCPRDIWEAICQEYRSHLDDEIVPNSEYEINLPR